MLQHQQQVCLLISWKGCGKKQQDHRLTRIWLGSSGHRKGFERENLQEMSGLDQKMDWGHIFLAYIPFFFIQLDFCCDKVIWLLWWIRWIKLLRINADVGSTDYKKIYCQNLSILKLSILLLASFQWRQTRVSPHLMFVFATILFVFATILFVFATILFVFATI